MSDWDRFVEEQLKNPEVRAEYDALEPEFKIIQDQIVSSIDLKLEPLK